jgi:mono/diheme cytochrome c family protein
MRASALAALLCAASTGLVARQAPSPSVFTAQQAAAGRSAYATSCGSCHIRDLSGSNDAPPLAGSVFMSTWRTRTTKDLFEYLSASMPPGGASLSTETYESITAYILEANGAPAGETPFRATTAVAIGDLIVAEAAEAAEFQRRGR